MSATTFPAVPPFDSPTTAPTKTTTPTTTRTQYKPCSLFNPLNWWRQPTAEALTHKELLEARRSLLESQRLRDYYTKMEEYYSLRISRLNESMEIEHGR